MADLRELFGSPESLPPPASAGLVDTFLFLESGPELVGNFFGRRLGSTLNLGAAAVLPVRFHPPADDESSLAASGT